jgi:DNA-directed RNA polymerase subunit beta
MTLPSPMPPRRRLGQPIAELPLPLLGDLQQRAFDHFVEHDLPAIFQSAFPIALRGQSLECLQVTLGDPPDWDECQRQGSTYGRAIRCRIGLRRGETGTVELIDLGLLPVPRQGRFLIEGKERVLISELLRGRGVVFTPGPGCKIIPERGKTIRLVLQARSNPYIRARIGSSRRGVPAVTLLRALAPEGCSDEELRGWLGLETDKELKSGSLLANSFLANKARSREQAQVLVGSILLSSPATLADDEAIQQFTQVLGDPARYDLGQLRRQQLNRRFRHDPPEEGPLLGPRDLVAALRIFSRIYVGEENPDRNEDLAYCQVRTAAEQMRAALCSALDYARTRLARDFKKHKQGLQEMWARPRETIQKKLLSLFGQNALCEPVSQVNPLDHLTQLRRTSAFGRKGLPSGAAYRVQRDSHPSHVGRLCPVETPEGANIGLHNSLALYARCDGEGYLQAPAYPVHNGQILSDLVWLRPGEEGEKWLVCADAPRSAPDRLASGPHLARRGDTWAHVSVQEVGFVDACSRQMLGLSAGLIPFIEHDDAIRALMGSNMQRQALPLLRPEPPRVGTGLEREISRQSSLVVVAEKAGTVVEVDGQHLVIDDQRYDLDKYLPLSEGACQNQKPIVAKGSKVRAGQVIADGAATAQGELALGTNLLVALMVWEGYNFEDAIVVSERLVSEDVLTSLHVEEFVVEARMFPGGGEDQHLPARSEPTALSLAGSR